MIKKIAAIAKWEFVEKLKTKAFLISLIITPIIIVSITILPSIIFSEEHPNVEVIGIIDTSGIYFDFIAEELQKYELPDGQMKVVWKVTLKAGIVINGGQAYSPGDTMEYDATLRQTPDGRWMIDNF